MKAVIIFALSLFLSILLIWIPFNPPSLAPRKRFTPATIALILPNNEAWQVGQTQTIKWKFNGMPAALADIDILANGKTYVLICGIWAETGEYSFRVPVVNAKSGEIVVLAHGPRPPSWFSTKDISLTTK